MLREKKTISVITADDHAIVREGVKKILSETPDIRVRHEAANGNDTIRICREEAFDVLLLDISMPDKNGIEVLKQVKKERPGSIVLMFSMHPEENYAIRALKAGAFGYLNKQCAPKDLVLAIRQVASGQKYISTTLAQELANHIDADHQAAPHTSLSDREYQTLTMIASGKAVSVIAKELSLSVKTISEYRSRLIFKMKLKNNAELTHYAIKNQLID